MDTGTWLRGRLVLIPLWALEAPDWEQRRVPVRLTREQVKNSPDIDIHQPFSRRAEAASLRYYGYPYYWGGPALWGAVPAPSLGSGMPITPGSGPPDDASAVPPEDPRDTHLRSWREVAGYHIRASDGEIGHVDDFVVDATTWRIQHLLIDTSNWIGGRSVLISPASVERVSWAERLVYVSMAREIMAER